MVAGLKFLSKKSFNPQNLTNQKNVYERQQEAKQEATKIRERNEQLKRERDDEELALARGDSIKVSFLYQAPPGMEGTQNSKQTGDIGQDDEKPEASILLAHRQPGDDDAAAKFRALLAGQLTDEAHEQSSGEQVQSGFSFALHGSEYDPINNSDKKKEPSNLTALEKAAGRLRKKDSLTLEGQIERFPALANAPRAKGISSADIGVNFKPLGAQIRNVKCLACGLWGHARGERECKKSGWNPFEMASSALKGVSGEDKFTSSDELQAPVAHSSSKIMSDDSSLKQKGRKKEKKSARRYEGDSSDSEESRRKRKHKRKKHKKHRRSDDERDQQRSKK